MKDNPRKKRNKSRLRLLHQYYKYTGFYSFVWKSLRKAIIPILLFLGVLWGLDRYIIDVEDTLITITDTYPPYAILAIFFGSESLLGLIPPELFIAWSGKTGYPVIYLSLLATASYLGGIISYFIGIGITKIPAVHKAIELKMSQHIKNTRKWGGFLIIVGALFPIPFSMTSIAAGIIRFPFTSYLLFGLLRFIRFYLYALVIFKMV
ncbi:YqaA family protein [Zunongwangia sp.]|uniref:YqaA family protein n=1 Tax=Zunongwangia sp. TaxID=1965325 RepID=UPI003AA973A9